ncbi:OLC1v1015303C1 [Oldenlandia corymbosa var. corymbosa]|uniref:OLC1v1015303C1 n=1 Tax=Oldenlandia corymbosa var. corymbosa TaxID=529605 RepID=A0AAV1E364_OLDCO|nr:OLC1v1015303C1 [Oldenlandia corymbosa var. corymbosa]
MAPPLNLNSAAALHLRLRTSLGLLFPRFHSSATPGLVGGANYQTSYDHRNQINHGTNHPNNHPYPPPHTFPSHYNVNPNSTRQNYPPPPPQQHVVQTQSNQVGYRGGGGGFSQYQPGPHPHQVQNYPTHNQAATTQDQNQRFPGFGQNHGQLFRNFDQGQNLGQPGGPMSSFPQKVNQNQAYPPLHQNQNIPNYNSQTFQNQKVGEQQQQQQQQQQTSVVDLRGICEQGKVGDALKLMDEGVVADAHSFSLLFELCSKSKNYGDAKKIHDYFLRSSCRSDLLLNNKVLDMYVKCGSMTDARRVFDHMPDRNLDSWNLMISGYGFNGLGDDGLALYDQMRKLGLRPNGVTFLAVLDACASVDAIDEGFLHFESMKTEYRMEPGIEHYLGLLGLLAKCGHLAEAEEFVAKKLPFEPTTDFWEALMNYARMHGDIDLEDRAEELMISVDSSKMAMINNTIPTPPPKKQSAINMLEGRNKAPELRSTTLYKDDEKLRAAMKQQAYVPDTRYFLRSRRNWNSRLLSLFVKWSHVSSTWFGGGEFPVSDAGKWQLSWLGHYPV